jgi:hypothetical protein
MASGVKLDQAGRDSPRFAASIHDQGAVTITTSLALGWAGPGGSASRRQATVRIFARR